MFRRWSAVVLMALVIGTPVTAGASGSWKWPVDGEPALSYGASYVSAAGKSCTHGGLDIAAPSGSRVVAAAAGEVVFSGLVPAGEGARAFAVTVLTSEGLRITYLPLASSAVRKGQAVDAGQDVGSLEGTGDASGGGSHLHLGVKRGDAPLDPSAFLGARGHAPAPSPAVAGGASAAPVTAPGSHSGSPAHAHAGVSSPAAGAVRVPSGSIAYGAAGAPQVSAAGAPGDAVQAALSKLSVAPMLTRVEQVAATPVLSLARIQADWTAVRNIVMAWAIRLAILLVAGACVWPVMKSARAAGARAVPVAVRHQDR